MRLNYVVVLLYNLFITKLKKKKKNRDEIRLEKMKTRIGMGLDRLC